mmetsp:Transcript_7071/g.20632  ORF Transcript_7071/g.20632 Transcript_7071/m.20632 type:complete len:324 (-) Transcript_7071:538-1509(-)
MGQLVQPRLALQGLAAVRSDALGSGPLDVRRNRLEDALHRLDHGLGRGEPAIVVPGYSRDGGRLDELPGKLWNDLEDLLLLELLWYVDPVRPSEDGEVGPDELHLLLEHLVTFLEGLEANQVLHQLLEQRVVLPRHLDLHELRGAGQSLDDSVDAVSLLDVHRTLLLVQPDAQSLDHDVVGVLFGLVQVKDRIRYWNDNCEGNNEAEQDDRSLLVVPEKERRESDAKLGRAGAVRVPILLPVLPRRLIRQGLVGLGHKVAEELRRRWIRVLVRMVLQTQLPVRGLDLLLRCRRWQLQDLKGIKLLVLLRAVRDIDRQGKDRQP